ncbi:hypothetical protein FRB95_003158 [Tulasnella sp. JGI-2019a]|nr:hypothetical protein FRB95_003158 [Tulasnella sp. JGI-2019a]
MERKKNMRMAVIGSLSPVGSQLHCSGLVLTSRLWQSHLVQVTCFAVACEIVKPRMFTSCPNASTSTSSLSSSSLGGDAIKTDSPIGNSEDVEVVDAVRVVV